jgi:hypothetical protein
LLVRETVIVVECSDMYDANILRDTFDPDYLLLHTKICPTVLGVCGRRRRFWGVLLLREGLTVFSSLDNVTRLILWLSLSVIFKLYVFSHLCCIHSCCWSLLGNQHVLQGLPGDLSLFEDQPRLHA